MLYIYWLIKNIDQIIIDEAVVVPLYYDQVIRFYQKNLSGLENNSMNMLILKRVKKD